MQRIAPGPGQQSVWDFPRPPRLESSSRRVRVVAAGVTVADTTRALRLLETSHPPGWYLPPDDVRMDLFEAARGESYCEFKGVARYWDLVVEGRRFAQVAWSYPDPTGAYGALRDHLAFYAGRVDACYVDDERVTPQEGRFYGGWITGDVVGPFKGGPGTMGW
ncbi:MAG: hypothetical protein CMN30_31980 [Sandaracinus sp.]|nr:hypothetical protein [Sandaracinus sp.]MAQ19406.1 hypothetical protein [Sandaracinus sp.]|tara:strand:+ start:879 stop:1367 length:489 start_codon:yes stop_codon:yes gene_type:complete